MRRPFQKLAPEYKLSDTILKKGTDILRELRYNKPMKAYDDYAILRDILAKKFLVTAGFTNMQKSKVKHLGIEQDFVEFHVADPDKSDLIKKDVFADIIQRHNLNPDEVLVIGDDPESEIQAGKDLGLETILYDQENFNPYCQEPRITSFS